MPQVTVIATVLNEGESIRVLMDSLAAQTRRPDRVVIVDGGSRDNTLEVLSAYAHRLPLVLLQRPGANISAGRNAAITAAGADAPAQDQDGDPIIAATDAGVVLEPDWLEKLVQPLSADPACAVSAGFFLADPHSVFEAALGATTLPEIDEIDPASFLPSSRSVAFRWSAWDRVGGYPEWLDYCEDLIFDLRLKALAEEPGARPFAFASGAVAHFRPRSSLRAYYRQYYRYARGDGKADLWRKRHAVRYATYLIGLPLLLILGAAVHAGFWGLLALGGAAYLRAPYRRLPAVLRRARTAGRFPVTPAVWLRAAALIPLLRVTGDIAKMIGYPVGWRWRIRCQPPEWRR
ncbi:MAG: glycosyltransferase [Anaerolineae bacterium]|nr:glycosyltransferase [Anaerolineae bacterium]NUQ04377.1 glycosyltransferase [Anaerolineae bacterium]